jgi:hypothetical protein
MQDFVWTRAPRDYRKPSKPSIFSREAREADPNSQYATANWRFKQFKLREWVRLIVISCTAPLAQLLSGLDTLLKATILMFFMNKTH